MGRVPLNCIRKDCIVMSTEFSCCLMSAGTKEIKRGCPDKAELHAFNHKASEIACLRRLSNDLHKAVQMKLHVESVCLWDCLLQTFLNHLNETLMLSKEKHVNMVHMIRSEAGVSLNGRPPGEKQCLRPKTYSWKVCEQACECLAYALKLYGAFAHTKRFQTSLFNQVIKTLRCTSELSTCL